MNVLMQSALLLTLFMNLPSVPSSWRAGIVAIDADTDEMLMDRNGSDYFRPASTMKLVTTLLALEELGPSFIYRTRIMADTASKVLYLVGSGAPLLTTENIRISAMETAAAVDPESSWSVAWDTTAFISESHCPGWDTSDWSRTYCPPIEGLSLGDNNVEIIISSRGGGVRTFVYPPLPDLELVNNLVTGQQVSITSQIQGWDRDAPTVILNGTIPPDTNLIIYKPYPGPPAEFSGIFAEQLESCGIRVDSLMPGAVPDSSVLVQTAVIYSEPLSVLLSSMNKWSRNMIAEMVLRTVSLQTGSLPASTAAGCDESGKMLKRLLPELTGFQLADGSGLSRYNLLTPLHLARVLGEGISSEEFGVEFLATLPVNGVDGTLSSRMSDLAPGAFRGKTGTLNDTSAIAGLLTASSGRRIILVIMLEVPVGQTWHARALQDQMVS